MNPAELLAALKALRAGLDDRIKVAEAAVLDVAERDGAERFTTPYGPITVSRKKGGISITDREAFIAWVDGNIPDAFETIVQVRPATEKAIVQRLTVMRGEVYDSVTGEAVEWAEPTPDGDPYTAWPASAQQREAKDMARLLFEDRAGALAAGLRELTGGTPE